MLVEYLSITVLVCNFSFGQGAVFFLLPFCCFSCKQAAKAQLRRRSLALVRAHPLYLPFSGGRGNNCDAS